MRRRQLTIRYIFFYILFLPDSWQVLAGVIAAYYLSPLAGLPSHGYGARGMLYIMIATIGYVATRVPARWITRILVKWILGGEKNLIG